MPAYANAYTTSTECLLVFNKCNAVEAPSSLVFCVARVRPSGCEHASCMTMEELFLEEGSSASVLDEMLCYFGHENVLRFWNEVFFEEDLHFFNDLLALFVFCSFTVRAGAWFTFPAGFGGFDGFGFRFEWVELILLGLAVESVKLLVEGLYFFVGFLCLHFSRLVCFIRYV